MTRHIRRYESADLEALLRVWESASRVGHPFLSEAFLEAEREAIATHYLPQSQTWVLTDDGVLIGFLSLLENEIGGLFVDAAWHGTGAGSALMDHAKRLHTTLELEVFAANALARRFYERAGFVEIVRHHDEETGQMLLRLRC